MAKGNNVVEFTLRAKDHVSRVLHSIGGSISGFAKGLLNQGANIKAWGEMIAGAVQTTFGKIWGAVREAFKFETFEIQFKTLLGSIDAAKARMQMLAKVAEETPFDLEGVVKANRILTSMTNNALGTEWALKLVGDAAAAVGGDVEELALWIGRAYSSIQAGRPFGIAAQRLMELKVVTPEVRNKLEELQAAGASNREIWDVLVEQLERFGGAMGDLSKTGDGLTATLQDNWTMAIKEFGDAFREKAKDSIVFLINKLKELQASGAITEWAERAVKALEPVRNLMVGLFGDENSRSQAITAAWDYLKAVFQYGGDVLKASADYMFDKFTSAADAVRNPVAYRIARGLEYTRYQWKRIKSFTGGVFGVEDWSQLGLLDLKREHYARLQGMDEYRNPSKQKARTNFTRALEIAKENLRKATTNLTEAVAEAAEEGKKAVEAAVEATKSEVESEEEKQKRLQAEKKQAAKTVDGQTESAEEAAKNAKLKALELQARAAAEMRLKAQEMQKRQEAEDVASLKTLRSGLDTKVKAAQDKRDEAYKRATDKDYAEEKEKEERESAKIRDRYNKRAKDLLKREGRKVLDDRFDLSKLSKRDRRLAEAMRTEKEAGRLEKLREKAYSSSIEAAVDIRKTREVITQLLELK